MSLDEVRHNNKTLVVTCDKFPGKQVILTPTNYDTIITSFTKSLIQCKFNKNKKYRLFYIDFSKL